MKYSEIQDLPVYNSVEVHPCIALDAATNEIVQLGSVATSMFLDQCEESNPNIYVWSVYLHHTDPETNGALRSIADCGTKELAELIADSVALNLAAWQGLAP